jgi:hypothetical protein
MKTFPLPSNYDWKKLGYVLYGNSVDYRKVIADNPQWSLDYLPPVGTTLRFQGEKKTGVHSSGVSPIAATSASFSPEIFPFSSEEEYLKALERYSPDALLSVEETNGWTLDSVQALTGLQ